MDNTCQHCGGLIYSMAKPCSRCGNPGARLWPGVLPVDQERVNLLMMTGTPILNTPLDVWTFAVADRPGDVRLEHRQLQGELPEDELPSGKWEFRAGGLDDLKPLIEDRYLQRTLAEVGIELPEQRVHIVSVDLDPASYPLQARTIEQISRYRADHAHRWLHHDADAPHLDHPAQAPGERLAWRHRDARRRRRCRILRSAVRCRRA